MPPSAGPSSFQRGRIPLSRRAVTLTLVILVHALLLLMLLRLAPPLSPPVEERVPTIFDLAADGQSRDAAEKPRRRERQARAAGREAERPTPPTPAPPRPTEPVDTSIWSKVMPLSRNELAQADISAMPRRAAGEGVQTAQAGTGDADDQVVGRAPNGEKLYAADWYREPTRAELSPYFQQNNAQIGWGAIACRTAANYRVEDCQEIGQSLGSGLARALRQAAWQFRVRPPMRGGKPMLGTWVRIRFDYYAEKAPG